MSDDFQGRGGSPWGTPPGGGSGNGSGRGPTPPLALEIAIVNFVPKIGFLMNFLGSNFFFIASLSSGFFSLIFLSLLVFYNKDTIYFVI